MDNLKLDLKDKRILNQLDNNARQPNSEIAKKVGLSKEVVNYRIKKLEQDGIIQSYYTIIDMSKLGYFSFRVYIKLLDTSPAIEEEMIKNLTKSEYIFYVAEIDGEYDINFGVWVKNIYEFETFYNTFKDKYKPKIKYEQISIFTKAHHLHRKYLLNQKTIEKIEFFGKSEQEKYDDTDTKILRLLSNNSRIHIIEISEKLNMPPRTVAFRIKQLEKKGIIQGYRALFNMELLGYAYFKVDFNLRELSIIKTLFNHVSAIANTVYVDQTIGGSDFEFDMEIENKKTFLKIINEIRIKFPEIRDWKYFTLNRYHKLIYFPQK
jgi:Lrp/AsnC family transcriptional regulator, leucine-responsive regulatory protein